VPEVVLVAREFFAEIEGQRYALEPHILEMARFEDWAGKDVLDVGCGTGIDGLQFAPVGARYVGIDASPVAVDLAPATVRAGRHRRIDYRGKRNRYAIRGRELRSDLVSRRDPSLRRD
jgi:2-polyprenyl-3-methyl-5-hydroxy-6-metoxy-1,4-benzoquinol methylase